jgi:AP2 domain/HNH endonuclease
MTNSAAAIPLEANPPGRPPKNRVTRYLDQATYVDHQDAERVRGLRWTLHRARSGIYVKEVGHGGWFLHRFVLDLPPLRGTGLVVDHKDHDTLNNRRENLRAVKNVLNLANSGSRRSAVHSLFKGVTYDISRNRWVAQIGIGNRHIHLGRYDSEVEAASAYNVAALAEWGESAFLNSLEA